MKQTHQNSFSKGRANKDLNKPKNTFSFGVQNQASKDDKTPRILNSRVQRMVPTQAVNHEEIYQNHVIKSMNSSGKNEDYLISDGNNSQSQNNSGIKESMMKILKFEKFFKNAEEGPRVSARNTALNDNSKKRQQLTSVSNLQSKKKIMSSTSRVQKKINYNSNMHTNKDEPLYDSIQSNILYKNPIQGDQKSRQSNFGNSESKQPAISQAQAQGFTFEKRNPHNENHELFQKQFQQMDQSAFFGAGNTNKFQQNDIFKIQVVDPLNSSHSKTLFKKSRPSMQLEQKSIIQETIVNLNSSDEDSPQGITYIEQIASPKQSRKRLMEFSQDGGSKILPYHKMVQQVHKAQNRSPQGGQKRQGLLSNKFERNQVFGNTFASGSQTQRGKLVSNDFDFHSVKTQQTGQKNFESNFDSKNCKKELEQSKPIVLLDNNEEFGNSANSSQISLDVSQTVDKTQKDQEQENLVKEFLELQDKLKDLKLNNERNSLANNDSPEITQQQEQEFHLIQERDEKLQTQKRPKKSHRNRQGVPKMMSMDRGLLKLKHSNIPIHQKGALSFGQNFFQKDQEIRSLSSMTKITKRAHKGLKQSNLEASSSFKLLAQQTMSPGSFSKNLYSKKKLEKTQQQHLRKKSFVSQKKGRAGKSWNQNGENTSSDDEIASIEREKQYIASASSNDFEKQNLNEIDSDSDEMQVSESSQQEEIQAYQKLKQRKTKAQRNQKSRQNKEMGAKMIQQSQRELKEQKKLQAYQQQILNLQNQLIKLQNKTIIPEQNQFNQSILSQNQFHQIGGAVSPMVGNHPGMHQFSQQFMTPQPNYRANLYQPAPDLQQQHLISQLQSQILDQQQQIDKITQIKHKSQTNINNFQHIQQQQQEPTQPQLQQMPQKEHNLFDHTQEQQQIENNRYQEQQNQSKSSNRENSERGGIQWGSQIQESQTPVQLPKYLNSSAKVPKNIQMRSYDVSNNFLNTDSTPINVGTIESPENNNFQQQDEFLIEDNIVEDFMVPEKDTNTAKNNILTQYQLQKQISKSKKDKKERLEGLLKIEKAKSGYPSMLDSGVYGMIVPKSLVGNDKVQNTQLVSDNDSISQNENLEEDNNFDTMINPKIEKIKASPDKREAKQELLIIGFDQKPKGKNPLLQNAYKKSPERFFLKDDASNLTGYEIGRAGPIINKSIKSEMSSRARWDQKFKNQHVQNNGQQHKINENIKVVNQIHSPKIMNTSESHKQITSSVVDLPKNENNKLDSTPRQRPFQSNHQNENTPDRKFGNLFKEDLHNLQNGENTNPQHKQIDETLNKSQDVTYTKDFFDQKTERAQKTRGDLLVIGDDFPSLQEVFQQKKSAQLQQKLAERNSKRSEFGVLNNNESSRRHTPTQSPRQLKQEDSFNIELGDNKSTATYGKVVRKAKTKEELAELRKQMMKKKFVNQKEKTEFTLGDVPQSNKAISQMDATSHKAFSAIGFKQNQDAISYMGNMQTSTFGAGKQMIIPSTDRQGQKTEKKQKPKLLHQQSRTQSQNKLVWETQSKIDDDLLSRLASGQKVQVDKKSSRQLTKKNFDKLPENRKKAEDQRKLEESKILKQKQAQYQKELDARLRQSFLNKKKRSRLKSQQSVTDGYSNIDSRHMAMMLQQQIEQTQEKSRGDVPNKTQTNMTGIIHKSRIETILASKSQGVLSPKSNNILSKKMSNIINYNNDGLVETMSSQFQQSPALLTANQKKLKKHRNSSQSNQLKMRKVQSKQSIEPDQSSQYNSSSLKVKQNQVAQATINLQRR